MKTKILVAAVGSALLISPGAMAQTQSQQQGGVLQQLFGSIFGSNQQASEQTLESDWNQRRRPFAQRQAALEARIDTAVRDGSLGRDEADQMRREYYDIVRLEEQYSANGQISQQQRSDLRTRYRALVQRVDSRSNGQQYGQPGYQAGGQTGGRWQSLSSLNNDFELRLAAGLQNRTLTRAEATRLRTDWQSLGRTELSYRTGGIDAREEADLWARYNAIDSRLGGVSGNMGGGFGDDRNTARWSQMETRLAEAERNGRISRVEAVQVRAQLGDLARLDTAYSAGGYNSTDRAYLTRRYGEIEQLLGARR